jgi:adenine C2-methylase RlmN of 23S rRNA A2503 and tRNA A37
MSIVLACARVAVRSPSHRLTSCRHLATAASTLTKTKPPFVKLNTEEPTLHHFMAAAAAAATTTSMAESADTRANLLDLSEADLRTHVTDAKLPAFRAAQLWRHIYVTGAVAAADADFATWRASGGARAAVASALTVALPRVASLDTSADRTRKWTLSLKSDTERVEAVYIPMGRTAADAASMNKGVGGTTHLQRATDDDDDDDDDGVDDGFDYNYDHGEIVGDLGGDGVDGGDGDGGNLFGGYGGGGGERRRRGEFTDDRGALCVSSQVGCSLACTFCHTGTMDKKKLRNLTAGEIVGQLMVAKQHLGDFNNAAGDDGKQSRRVSNLVFMGMGEPLYNYRNLNKALQTIMHPAGLGYSKRSITVSTSGVVPGIDKLGADSGVNLAISLHATTDALRDDIVPINKTFPLRTLLASMRRYPSKRRITVEYVMLDGMNDSVADARRLVDLLRDTHTFVNVIPFNPWAGAPYRCSSNNQIYRFAEAVSSGGVKTTIRWPRGRDIGAACGQLAARHELDTPPTDLF